LCCQRATRTNRRLMFGLAQRSRFPGPHVGESEVTPQSVSEGANKALSLFRPYHSEALNTFVPEINTSPAMGHCHVSVRGVPLIKSLCAFVAPMASTFALLWLRPDRLKTRIFRRRRCLARLCPPLPRFALSVPGLAGATQNHHAMLARQGDNRSLSCINHSRSLVLMFGLHEARLSRLTRIAPRAYTWPRYQ
jgi:hypothetical protein